MTGLAQQENKKYNAFISYRHADNKVQGRQWATWLHQAIETYEIPNDLIGKKNARGDVIPQRIYPIFRDEEELPAHADLGTSIVAALEQTKLLVVLCSPRAVASTYVADEIDYFKKLGRSGNIIAAIIDGEPNTSWDESKYKLGFTKEDECFPIPLQFEYDQDGNPTDKHAEPIAADFRINNDGTPEEGWTTPAAYREHLITTNLSNGEKFGHKGIDKKVDSYQQQVHLMLLKIVAGILGVPLSELTQRNKEYQLEQAQQKAKKLRQWLATVAMLAIIAFGAGTFAYIQKNEEVKAKNRTEKLLTKVRANLDFMNFDLRDVLKAYVPTDLRAEMLTQVDNLIEVLQQRGGHKPNDRRTAAIVYTNKADVILQNSNVNPEVALLLLKKAHKGFTILANEHPKNTTYQLDLFASHNRLGNFQSLRGDNIAALVHYQAGMAIAEKMMIIDPSNTLFQQSLFTAHNKLGDLIIRLGDTLDALAHYQTSMSIAEKLSTFNPINTQFQRNLAISHNNIGDLQFRECDASEGLHQRGFLHKQFPTSKSCDKVAMEIIEHYHASLIINKALTTIDPSNILFKLSLSLSHEKIGKILLRFGYTKKAAAQYESSRVIVEKLTKLDPSNTLFQNNLSLLHKQIGALKLSMKKEFEALIHYRTSHNINQKLSVLDPNNTSFLYNLSLTHEHLGDVEDTWAMAEGAEKHYNAILSITRKLTVLDPKNIQLQRHLFLVYLRLARRYGSNDQDQKQLEAYDSALALLINNLTLYNKKNHEKHFKKIATSASLIVENLGKLDLAAHYWMLYIRELGIGIDIVTENMTDNKIELLNKHQKDYLFWSNKMLRTKKVNELPTILNAVISYLPEKEIPTIALQLNLANAYLLSGDYKAAVAIHKKYKNFTTHNRSWSEIVIDHFNKLEKDGITHPDFKRVIKEVFGEDFATKPNIKTQEDM